MKNEIRLFVKDRRKRLKLTQHDLADRAGVGLRFVRELEHMRLAVVAQQADGWMDE